MPFLLDVTDNTSINKCIDATIETYKTIDFINNAGISSVTAVDDENFENYWDRYFKCSSYWSSKIN